MAASTTSAPTYGPRDSALRDETIELTSMGQVNALGPNLVLHDCSVLLAVSARDFTAGGVEMHGGLFQVKKQLTRYQFRRMKFFGVTFKGRFSGVDFGEFPLRQFEIDRFGEFNGAITDCDFSDATLIGCRFCRTDMSRIVPPRAGHLAFLLDEKIVAALSKRREQETDINKRAYLEVAGIGYHALGVTGEVANIKSVAKRFGVNAAEAKDWLCGLPGAVT